MHFCKLEKTWDHWLFLSADEGNDKAILLHDELYGGKLKPYLREDLPYSPHIGLGLFSVESYDFHNPTAQLALDENKYISAKAEFEAFNLDLWCTVDSLTMVQVNEEFTECEDLITFSLKTKHDAL